MHIYIPIYFSASAAGCDRGRAGQTGHHVRAQLNHRGESIKAKICSCIDIEPTLSTN